MSKRKFFIVPLLALFPLLSLSYAGGADPAFQAQILDTSGVHHLIQGVELQKKSFSFFGGGGGKKGVTELTFFYGKAEITVPFQNIEKISVQGRDKKIAVIEVSMVGGKKLTGQIKSTLQLVGSQQYASSYKIQFVYIKTIAFKKATKDLVHCSTCKRTYWKKAWKYCPYDGKKLTR